MRPTAVIAFRTVPLCIAAPASFDNATAQTPGMINWGKAVRDFGATAE